MSIVNFSITAPLEKQINRVIREDGFTSKAEFFRFSAQAYLEKRRSTKERLAESVARLEKLFDEKLKDVDMSKWPSDEEQLKDLL